MFCNLTGAIQAASVLVGVHVEAFLFVPVPEQK